jgi:hypothetical protein
MPIETNVLSYSNGVQLPILHHHRCSAPACRGISHICPWWACSVHNFTTDNSYMQDAFINSHERQHHRGHHRGHPKESPGQHQNAARGFLREPATSSFSKGWSGPLPLSRFSPYWPLCWWASMLSDLSWFSGQWSRALTAGRE